MKSRWLAAEKCARIAAISVGLSFAVLTYSAVHVCGHVHVDVRAKLARAMPVIFLPHSRNPAHA